MRLFFLLLITTIICFACKKSKDVAFADLNDLNVDENIYTEDLEQLYNMITRLHPSVYRFSTAQDFEDLYQQQRTLIDDETNLDEFFTIAAPIVGLVGCGHTTMSIPSEFFENYATQHILPYKFLAKDDEIFVIRDYNNTGIPLGARIVSINETSSEEFIPLFKSMLSADGHRKTGLENDLTAYFRRYFAINYGFSDSYDIVYDYNGSESEISASSMTYNGIMDVYMDQYYTGLKPDFKLEIDQSSNTATLNIRTFVYTDNTPFFSFIDSCFNELSVQNIQNLIIDIRGNGGGDPYCASYLLQHIMDEEFRYFSSGAAGFDDLKAPLELDENAYSGTIYMLVDGGVFSTAGHFSALVKYHEIATIIGQETDGGYSCNDGHDMHTLTNTGLEFSLAKRIYSVAVAGVSYNHGVIPDHPIEINISDKINGVDTEIEYVMSLITR